MRIEIFADNNANPPMDVFRVIIGERSPSIVTLSSRPPEGGLSFDRGCIPGIVAALEKAYELTEPGSE